MGTLIAVITNYLPTKIMFLPELHAMPVDEEVLLSS